MRTTFKFLGWVLLACVIVSVALVIAGAACLAPFEHATISINGDDVTLGQLHAGLQGVDWLFAIGGVLIAVLVLMFVVPLAVLLPLLIVALVAAAGVFAMAGAAALLLSPLILLVWLIWRLARPRRRAGGGATIVG